MKVSLQEFRSEIDKLNFADSQEEAQKRFDYYSDHDPYPDIPASLLHSGHIANYISATGMVEPFDPERLNKPATYLIPLEGEVTYRNESGEVEHFFLSNDRKYSNHKGADVKSYFLLKRNMLCYVTLKPTFRIPNYLACRFNLQVRDVYRGILVGTGPLVDPGYLGRLSIPVHNFTSSDYVLYADESFVYFEFTKVGWTNPTKNKTMAKWVGDIVNNQPPFPSTKIDDRKQIKDYFLDKTPPQSTLSAEFLNNRKVLDEAKAEIKELKSQSRWLTAGAIVAAISLVLTSWQVIQSAQEFVQSAQQSISQRLTEIETERRSITTNADE